MFGQLVIGPPGCGKSTYCNGLSQFYSAIEREHFIVNLDPANDKLPYSADVDISELISLKDVMKDHNLGPNGGIIYCMEFLEANIEWLFDKLHKLDKYLIIDCPGQVELFTNHESLRNILRLLQKRDVRLCVVNLMDSHYCADPARFVSMLMVTLRSMLQLESPQINILSKIDLIESYGSLDYYTEVQDLSYLLELLNNDAFSSKYKALNQALCELVEEYGLVSFLTLAVQDKDSMLSVVRAIDKANGFVFGGLEEGNNSIFGVADRWEAWDRFNRDIGERYVSHEYVDGVNLEEVAQMMNPIKENNF